MLRLLRGLLALAVFVAVVTFSVANRTPVPVSFWPTPVVLDLPVYGVLLVGLGLGALLAVAVLGGRLLWLLWENRELRRRLQRYEREVRAREEAAAEARLRRLQAAVAARERGEGAPPPAGPAALPASA